MFFLFILEVNLSVASTSVMHRTASAFDPLIVSILLMVLDSTFDPLFHLPGLHVLPSLLFYLF
jgi:hypothetical protein